MTLSVCPMIQVANVEAASAWYQRVLGLVSGHGGAEFEMLFAGTPNETPLLLQLHRWEAHEHGSLGRPDLPVGNGSSLWFKTSDRASFDAAVTRAVTAGAEVLEGPAWNPLAHHYELMLRDADGYVLALTSPLSFEQD